MADTIIDLGRKVKAKYPDYADMSDEEVGRKVKAKFPGEYDDFIDISSKPGTLERVEKAADLPSLAPASDWPSMGPQFRQQLKDLYYGVAGIVPQTNAALQKTGQAMLRGDALGTVREAPGIVPVIGPQAQQIGQDVEQGNYPEAGGHFIRLGTQLLAPRAISRGPAAMEAGAVRAQQGTAIAGGAARGAWEESTKPGSISLRRIGLPFKIDAPRIVAAGGYGLAAGEVLGNHPVMGATLGAAIPVIKGAIQGGRKANQAFKAKNLPKPPSGPSLVGSTSHNPVVGEGPLVNVQNPPVPAAYNPVVGEGPLVGIPQPPQPAPYNPVVGEGPLTAVRHETPAPYNPVVGEGPTVSIKPQPVVQPYNPVVGEGPIVQVESPPPRGQTTTGTGTVGKGMPPAPEMTPPPTAGTKLDRNNPEHVEATIEAKRLEIQQRKAEIAAAEKAAVDKDKFRRTDLNRAAHAIGSELDLPESPAGKKLSMNTVSQGVHGKNWGELSTDQMNGVVEFMMTHRRPPTRADILSGTYKP